MARTLEAHKPAADPIAAFDAEKARLDAMDTDALRAELGAELQTSVASLLRLALIVRILEEREIDLSELKLGMLHWLRKIAHGQLLPETVVRFSAHPGLLQMAAALPLPDQREVASGEPVLLVVRKDTGQYDTRRADALKLTKGQASQVFGQGRLRDEAEQILFLEERAQQKPSHRTVSRKFGRMTAEPNRGGVRVGKVFVPAGAVVEALAHLRDNSVSESDAQRDTTVVTKVTEGEAERLKLSAIRAGTSVGTLLYRSLAAAGLFAGPGLDEVKGK